MHFPQRGARGPAGGLSRRDGDRRVGDSLDRHVSIVGALALGCYRAALADCVDPSPACNTTPAALPKLTLSHDELYDSIVFSQGQAELHGTMGSLKDKLKAKIQRMKGAIKGVVDRRSAEVKSEHINHLLSKAQEYGVASVQLGKARGAGSGETLELTVEAPEHKR
jgi:hypothetical protein